MVKKMHPIHKGMIIVTILIALLLVLFLINQLFAEIEKRNIRQPVSEIDYAQQLEMKEYHQSEGRHNIIIFENDNDKVEIIY